MIATQDTLPRKRRRSHTFVWLTSGGTTYVVYAYFIRRPLPFEFEAVNELPGLGVGVTRYDAPGDQPRLVGKVIGELLRRGFSHSQIVILTTHHVVTPGAPRSALDGSQRVGNYRLRRFTGEYDLFGNQITSAGQITFDSVTRFKGQESPAVILVDVDPDPKDQDRPIACCSPA